MSICVPNCDARTRRALRLLPAWICALLLSACPPPEVNPGEGEGEGEGEVAACVRTDALDAPRDCVDDDDCACGAHCDRGACAFDCRVDADCGADSACDDFGRCAAPGAPRVRFSLPAGPRVRPGTPVVRIAAPDVVYPVSIPPPGDGRVHEVRVRPVGGARVQCGDGPLGDGCTVSVGVEGAVVGLAVADLEVALNQNVGLDLLDDSGTARVRAVIAPPPAQALQGLAAGDVVRLAGRYAGIARLGDGAGLVGAVEGSVPFEAPIAARAFAVGADAGVLVLDDVLGHVLPQSSVAWRVAGSERENSVDVVIPRTRWLSLGDAEIVTDAVTVPVDLGASLAFSVELPLLSRALPGEPAPRLTLNVALTRVGPLLADDVAPTADADDVATFGPERARDRLALGAAVNQLAVDLAAQADTRLTVDDSVPADCTRDDLVARRPVVLESMCAATYPNSLEGRSLAQAGVSIRSMHPPSTCVDALQPDGSALIPCRFVGEYSSLTAGFDFVETFSFDEDVCVAMQSLTDCTIVDIDVAFTDDRSILDLADNHRAIQGCLIPPINFADEGNCTAATLCAATPAGLETSNFFTSLSTASGDALCGQDSVSRVAPGLEVNPGEAATLVQVCADDLDALAGSLDFAGGDLSPAFVPSECLSGARVVFALDAALERIRDGEDAPTSARIAHRLVQQLLQTQVVVGQAAMDVHKEALALGGDAPVADTLARLEATEVPWQLVLDARVAGPLAALPPDVLAEPDYRADFGLPPDATTPAAPAEGLSVAMLEAAAITLEGYDLLLDRAWRESNAAGISDLRSRFAHHARRMTFAAQLAESLHARAQLASSTLAWETAYQSARARYAIALRRHADRLELIDTGKNPIGLERNDLPIYFPGEPDNDRDRFVAVSRFLGGTGPGSLALAPRAVSEAQAALTAARQAFRERTDVDVNAQERIDDITRRYGELITGFCGAPIGDDGFDVDTFNVLDRPLDVETCFIEPSCRTRTDAFRERVNTADLSFELCVAARSKEQFASAVTIPADLAPAVAAIGPALVDGGSFPLRLVRLEQPSPNSRIAVVSIFDREVSVPVNAEGRINFSPPAALFDPRAFGGPINEELGDDALATPDRRATAIFDSCAAIRARTLAPRLGLSPGPCGTADQCPVGNACVDVGGARQCQPFGADPLDSVDCYFDGAIAEQALAVRQGTTEIEIARAEFEDFSERYDIAMRSCFILEAGQNQLERMQESHAQTMKSIDIARTVLNGVAEAAEAWNNCASAADPLSLFLGSAVQACVAGSVAGVARAGVDALETTMRAVEQDHAVAVQRVENDIELSRCFNDADLELVGARAALLRVQAAQQAQAQAVINLRGQKSYTAALHVEGNIAIENERRRLARALPVRSVLADAAEVYLDRFDYAQRLTFLAVRAAEYELQLELPQLLRDTAAATEPSQLETVLRDVASAVNAGQIEGSNPNGLLAVVSLRDHLLQLRSQSDRPAGEQNLSSVERFRLLLTDPAYAVFDNDGRYLGQEIPFSLQPLGALGLGNVQGIGLFSQNECAERLFAVNAAVLGDDVLRDGASFTRLDLLQKDTFFSQKCRADNDEPFQVATVQPAVNLLSDHTDFSQRNLPAAAGSSATRGQMQPYVNVDRAEFEREEFQQGSTTQLASRGLYGDYALFIPAGALSINESAGLDLARVDDILLRFDYVAVAR